MKPKLTIEFLKKAAKEFCKIESKYDGYVKSDYVCHSEGACDRRIPNNQGDFFTGCS
ncbi:MAG: hypothetical protein Q7J16_12850 [Candidatus Cloacimonadales bacterium]|nr:hypothetical protein [Candidatus Cloacimonadales bacterium]